LETFEETIRQGRNRSGKTELVTDGDDDDDDYVTEVIEMINSTVKNFLNTWIKTPFCHVKSRPSSYIPLTKESFYLAKAYSSAWLAAALG